MANTPFSGAAHFIAGWGLITQKGIRGIVFLPLLINTLLFVALIYFGTEQFTVFLDYLKTLLPSWLPAWLLSPLWIIFVLTAILLVMFGFSLVANLISAPFNGLLAEKIEARLRGDRTTGATEEKTNWKRIIMDFIPAIWDEIWKVFYYLLWMLPILLLLIPPFNLIFPFVWFIYSAWVLVAGYADYPLGNHGLKFKQQRILLKRKRILVLSFGSLSLLAVTVPLLNLFAMPASVAGATRMWVYDFAELPEANETAKT